MKKAVVNVHDLCCFCCRNQAQEQASKLQKELAEKVASFEELKNDFDQSTAEGVAGEGLGASRGPGSNSSAAPMARVPWTLSSELKLLSFTDFC